MKQELTLEEARLAARVAATLNRAAQEKTNADWDKQVDLIVTQGNLMHQRHRRRQLSAGLALAASVAFMVALPSGWLMKTSNQLVSTGSQSGIEAQLLEEMDWLLSMEEASRAAQ
ncbi:MAG: hypothetical protein U0998_05220 [Moraxellaceae bacterium]|nr:hypothetical protein [Moraxellaceae bacterium]MDZ4386608.1 hypothetical protein [Moraxellaceae bacterium]